MNEPTMPYAPGRTWSADDNRWVAAKAIMGNERVLAGPQLTHQILHDPNHLAFVLARYRAAAALIGDAESVLEVGCGEGIGAGILAKGRRQYTGIDPDIDFDVVRNAIQPICETFEVVKGTLCSEGICSGGLFPANFQAAVSLDVIEHVATDEGDHFVFEITRHMAADGVCVIGTPNETAATYASPQSQAGHVNLYDHDRLHTLMARHFALVQSFGMQDTSLHMGHPQMRHYLLMVGVNPR